MKFQAKVIPSGNATAVEVPADVLKALAAGPRPAIAVTVNGHTWRSRIASMHGKALVGISAANRAASGIAEGDVVEVDLVLDEAPRVVVEPPDLASALNDDPAARASAGKAPVGCRRPVPRQLGAEGAVKCRPGAPRRPTCRTRSVPDCIAPETGATSKGCNYIDVGVSLGQASIAA